MEVQRTTTEGKTVISETLKLTYCVYTKGSKKEVVGEIRKNDEVIGYFNASSNRIIGFSLSEGNTLDKEDIRKVSAQFFEDIINILEL